MAQISVIIPVYQAEDFLEECLDSVLGQTFQDLEVIAVDDGSTDESSQILADRAKLDPRLKVLRQDNAGQAAARNKALAQSTAPWICFVDSDDRIHPQMLEILYHAVQSSGCPVSQCRMSEGTDCPEEFQQDALPTYSLLTMDEATLERMYRNARYPGWVACAKLIRRDLVEGYPFRQGRVYEDNEAVCHWLVAGKTMADIPQELYFYRTNPASTTKGPFTLKQLDYLWALESILAFYNSLGWLELRERFLELYVQASSSYVYAVRNELHLPDRARQVEQDTLRFLKRQGIHLSTCQKEFMLDAMHPHLSKVYWPVAGLARTYRSDGLSGCVRKVKRWCKK